MFTADQYLHQVEKNALELQRLWKKIKKAYRILGLNELLAYVTLDEHQEYGNRERHDIQACEKAARQVEWNIQQLWLDISLLEDEQTPQKARKIRKELARLETPTCMFYLRKKWLAKELVWLARSQGKREREETEN